MRTKENKTEIKIKVLKINYMIFVAHAPQFIIIPETEEYWLMLMGQVHISGAGLYNWTHTGHENWPEPLTMMQSKFSLAWCKNVCNWSPK